MKVIIISASSDIGAALAKNWSKQGWEVYGTFRTRSNLSAELENHFQVKLVHCDLSDKHSIELASRHLIEKCSFWDALVIAPGDLEPVGDFQNVNFEEWEQGIQLNLIQQLRMLHSLLPYRNLQNIQEPSVLFFAGGGINNAVRHYSSYTLSKVALIKMCEFLDAEIPDTRFVIVGPGIVKTKIHEPTLRLKKAAGDNYKKTLHKLMHNECTPMQDVVDCCHYLITTSCKSVSGRNFSVVADKWKSKTLEKELEQDSHMYKLRRYKNT